MTPLSRHLRLEAARFLRNEDAATAIEYSLIAAGIGVAIMSAVFLLGARLASNFWEIMDILISR